HHQSGGEFGFAGVRASVRGVAPRQGDEGAGGARGDAPAQLLRRDDGGDAPGGWVCVGHEPEHGECVAAVVPDYQGGAAGDDGVELPGDGGGGHAFRRERGVVDGGLRGDPGPDGGAVGGHRGLDGAVGAAARGGAAQGGAAVVLDEGERAASFDWQGAGGDGDGRVAGARKGGRGGFRRGVAGRCGVGAGNRR